MEKNEVKSMLEKARKGDVNAQKMVVAEYCNGGYYKIGDAMVAEDKCWMGRLAQEGNVNAICCVREGYMSVLKPWAKPLFESEEAEAELNALKDVIRSVDGLTDDDIEQVAVDNRS